MTDERRSSRPLVVMVGLLTLATVAVILVRAGTLAPGFAVFSMILALALLFWVLRDRIASILGVFLGVLLVTTMATQRPLKLTAALSVADIAAVAEGWSQSGAFDERLPVVVHLVFDEMMSTGALDADLPGSVQARTSFYDLGRRYGFRTYDAVYSRHFFSGISLPNLFRHEYLGRHRQDDIFISQQDDHRDNPYFDEMAARGYRTAVFQTALMRFCSNPRVALCETFDSFDPGEGSLGLDVEHSTLNLWRTLLRAYEPSYLSWYGRALLTGQFGVHDGGISAFGVADRYDVHRFTQWFDRFASFIAEVPRGTHVFAHFMVPHAPYLLTEDCVVADRRVDAGYYLAKRFPADERAAKRRTYYGEYLPQLGCVRRKLDELLSAMADSPRLRDATIVVHGDHGSRITSGNTLNEYSERDFVDNYGTYFAIRKPGVEPGIDCEFISLPEVFNRHMAPPAAAPPPGRDPLPVLVDQRTAAGVQVVEAAMPKFGCAAGGPR